MKVNFYFAYGSNLDESQMRIRCPEARVLSKGYLKRYRLDFTRYSSGWNCRVADIVRNEESGVWGVVYEIKDSELEELDYCEAYPDAYTRFQRILETPSGPLQGVWVYTRSRQASVYPSYDHHLDSRKTVGQ